MKMRFTIYIKKVGYLYECDNLKKIEAPTQINCAYTSTEAIAIDRVTMIPDLYVFFKKQEETGLFRVETRNEISDKEMSFVLDELRKDISKSNLKQSPQHAMSVFIQKYFPTIWEVEKD